MPADTTVPVSDEVWRELMLRKNRGDTFDDVLRRELGFHDDAEAPAEADADSEGDEAPTTIHDAIAAWVPEQEVDADQARVALQAAVDWLANQPKPKRKGEIVAGAYAGPLSERSWWERAVQPGLRELDGVEMVGRKYRVEKE